MMQSTDLLLSSYDFELPSELIAQRPTPGRHNSKLLVYNLKDNTITHSHFNEVHKFLPKDSLLVLNQSKVFPCRLFGQKKTGAKIEIFILSLEKIDGLYHCLVKSSGKKKIGDGYEFAEGLSAQVKKIDEGKFFLEFSKDLTSELLDQIAHVPIPPYIRDGVSDEKDKTDYQTVYASENDTGSVAAPTAGLHLTQDVFNKLSEKNIDQAFVTLHVGLGTFAPVKTDNLSEHKMHSENYYIDDKNLKVIQKAKRRFAVGTTSLRVLESSYKKDNIYTEPGEMKETSIFLHPGKNVESIDGLITNFHLPKSTLLMLVSSLIGREKTLEIYQEAIKNEYRFFSYGDAMLILR